MIPPLSGDSEWVLTHLPPHQTNGNDIPFHLPECNHSLLLLFLHREDKKSQTALLTLESAQALSTLLTVQRLILGLTARNKFLPGSTDESKVKIPEQSRAVWGTPLIPAHRGQRQAVLPFQGQPEPYRHSVSKNKTKHNSPQTKHRWGSRLESRFRR